MITTEEEIVEFVYFVNEPIDELFVNVAHRRVGCTCKNKAGLKIIKCPCCGGRLTDIEASAKVELYRNPQKNRPLCHKYIRCKSCNGEVGVMLKSA